MPAVSRRFYSASCAAGTVGTGGDADNSGGDNSAASGTNTGTADTTRFHHPAACRNNPGNARHARGDTPTQGDEDQHQLGYRKRQLRMRR